VGKTLLTPLYDKPVKVVADDKVEAGFGTGVVMICTIGDKDDLSWVYKYDLPLEQGIDEHGRMTEVAGKYKGLPIERAREAIIDDLEGWGLLDRQEDLPQNVGGCWRCHTPIEYLQVPQWFIRTIQFKDQVLAASDEIEWFPEFMKVRLEEWVNSLSWDWVVSRQRYFATPIPVWECSSCDEVVLPAEEDCYVDPTVDEPPVDSCPKCGGELKGCHEVFDTWMDSSITPLYNTFWEREPEKFARMYPMSLRPQAHDIIRTWAYYTILRGLYLTGRKPFENIMMGGFILAPDGTPMHASKGNSVDPLEVLEEHGADALRYFAACCALGKDNPFRIQDLKRGVQVCDKLYNINQLISKALEGLEGPPDPPSAAGLRPMDVWLLMELEAVREEVTGHCDVFRFDQAMRATANFMWHSLADNYLEIVKKRIYDPADGAVRSVLYRAGLDVLKMMAPFIPHITEELYHQNFAGLDSRESIHISPWPEPVDIPAEVDGVPSDNILEWGRMAVSTVESVRRWKSGEGMPLNAPLEALELPLQWKEPLEPFGEDVKEALKVGRLDFRDLSQVKEEVVAVRPVHSALGPAFRKDARAAADHLAGADPAAVGESLAAQGKYIITLPDGRALELGREHVSLEKSFVAQGEKVEAVPVGDGVVFVMR
jgi:valyl-tRNA synthetase